jgi:hypothetical protein
MGAFATLHFGYRALSLTVAGGGYGAHPAQYARFQADARANAEFIREEGMARFSATYGPGPRASSPSTRTRAASTSTSGSSRIIR